MIKIGFDNKPVEEYIIDIRERGQVIKARYAIDEKDVYKYDLMGDHYIQIFFVLDQYVWFERGNYITWEGSKFILREDYVPNWKSKDEIEYTLQFDSKEMLAKDVTNYYLNQQMEELEWNLFADAKNHLTIFCQNMNRYFGTKEWVVGTVESIDMQNISYNNTTAWDGLNSIAEAFESEFYFTGTTVHLVKKVSFGSEIDFEDEINVIFKSRTEGDGERPYNRIVALGSTRNIPSNYRETINGENVDAVYQKRLRIPADKGNVIDAYPDLLPEEVIETGVVFDDIYPKRIGTISGISTVEYSDTNSDTGVVTKWNAYRFKDTGLKFKKEYLLPGTELRIVFQNSKRLNGLDFAVKYNPKDKLESDPEAQLFEIIRNDTYGKDLPNETLYPEVGDEYILYGFNIQLVSDQFVPAAEKELYDAAVEWLKENRRDKSVWEYDSMINCFAENSMDLELGQKIKIINESFKEGYRSSRLQGFEKRLINKYQATYTVGDNAAKSWAKEVDNSIKQLQVTGVSVEGTKAGNSVYIIKQFDSTTPSDFNVYSAKATDAKYLNKQTGGTVQGDTLFQKNLQVQGLAISDVFQNSTFTAGQFGSGFQLKRDTNGQSYMEIDNLLVRREAVFNRLTIAEIKSVGGTILLSLANMVVSKVENKTSTFKCYFDSEDGTIPNDFAVGDQAICRKFTGKNIKYYWALVTAVGSDYIELSKTDKDGSGVPDIDDEVVQLGNRTDVNRQYAIMLSAYGSAAPSINQYAGINSYDLTGKEVTAISPKGNKFTGSFTISSNGTTAPIYKDTGLFENGKTYYLNDRVSHLGSYWVCIVNSTVQTPNESSSVWRKDTTGTTDINNAINNIEIGNRNYLYREFWQSYWIRLDVDSGTNLVENGVLKLISGTGTSGFIKSMNNYITDSSLLEGSDCMLSFDIKSVESNLDFAMYISGTGMGLWNQKTGTQWKRFYFSFNYEFSKNLALCFNFLTPGSKIYYVRNIQLEKGNKATDYKLSDEELQADIAAWAESVRTEYKADFKVLNDQISSKVSQSDFNTLGNRVSTTESDITQLSGSITSTVEQINNLQVGNANPISNLIVDWEQGTINQSAALGSSYAETKVTASNRIRSKELIYVGDIAHISFSSNCKVFILFFDSNKKYLGKYQGWLSSDISFADAIQYIAIAICKADGSSIIPAFITDCTIKLEKGSNKTYYSDTKPLVPSGGFSTGDIWYKTSLVDSSGNINADKSKNIFQLQYRWNGSTWVQINWSASKSKIEQTDKSITSVVEKTGINSLGNGETLFSKINQTAEQITLEVNNIQIGGSNYVKGSDVYITAGNLNFDFISYKGLRGQTVTISVDIEVINAIGNRIGFEPSFDFADGTSQYIGVWHYVASNANFKGRLSKTFTILDKEIKGMTQRGIYIQCTGSLTKVGRPQLEIGNKASDWTPASEDIPDMVGSSFTLKDNMISLASTTIELKGTTIAKSIEAEDLKVGSRAGSSALEVLKNGTFYAKGSSGMNQSLVIDSGSQSIEIKSSNVASGLGDAIQGSTNITMSGKSGGITVSGATSISTASTSIVSSAGIFSNTAGQRVYESSTGVEARASIVGLGWGNLNTISINDGRFVAGVYGSSFNKGTAPSFGGCFDVLKANGLCLSVRSARTNTQLDNTDCYVSCYNTAVITIDLPSKPYIGQIIYIRQINVSGFNVRGKNGSVGYQIHTDGSLVDTASSKGRGDTLMMLFDGTYWMYNYMGR